MIRAFTGPSDLDDAQVLWVARRILARAKLDVIHGEIWRSGCARGTDSIAARLARAIDRELELFIPFAPHNEILVRELAPYSRIIRAERKSSNALAYRHRNEIMVGGARQKHVEPADELHAFVKRPEFYRSGEWMTINIALNADNAVNIEVIPEKL